MYQPNNENENPLKKNKRQILPEAGPSRMEVTDSSDEEQELSLAEESVIEECLNDTEGSLSSVDLDFFAPSPPHKRSRKPSIDLLTLGFVDDSSISPIEDIPDLVTNSNELPELTDLNINPSVEEFSKKIEGFIKKAKEINENNVIPSSSSAKALTSGPKSIGQVMKTIHRRVMRRKRRNSPPSKKYDKAHIFSFFSAMADLVETFPSNQISKAALEVRHILRGIVMKVQDWKNDTSPNKHFRDAVNDTDLLRIKIKLSKLYSLYHKLNKSERK